MQIIISLFLIMVVIYYFVIMIDLLTGKVFNNKINLALAAIPFYYFIKGKFKK